MNAHRTEATIDKDGTLILRDVPFQPGAQVEVIILERALHSTSEGKDPYPLHGKPVQYDAPTEPVAEEGWGVLR